MKTVKNTDKTRFALALGDDALVMGQRLSEWVSNGPFLEEDLALTNVALDYIGRSRMFLTYAGELEGEGRGEDDLAFYRDCREFTNLLIFELPIGDFGNTMARQYLIDEFEVAYFEALCKSSDETIAAIAAKTLKECRYHLRRSREWILRLGDGTEESHQRIQAAFDEIWPYVQELFEMPEYETGLLEDGVAVDRASLKPDWDAEVGNTLREATLNVPETTHVIRGGRDGVHTEHMGFLLADMQFMQRAYPGLEW
ncbi:MAG TPA: 1,2-phenylacetyl-CoA epoxidase subunit PaaC [Xanthomonadales bacterium]|nr:1,2-phenylacetyl-CoA epoxidase subunit PaaC [Xanthomonadales bacterium]